MGIRKPELIQIISELEDLDVQLLDFWLSVQEKLIKRMDEAYFCKLFNMGKSSIDIDKIEGWPEDEFKEMMTECAYILRKLKFFIDTWY